MKIGAKVRWSSQAAGREVQKRGKIICIVPAETHPFKLKQDCNCYVLPDGQKIPYSRTRYGGGLPREEVSYIVRVENEKNPRLAESYYWPRTSGLIVDDE